MSISLDVNIKNNLKSTLKKIQRKLDALPTEAFKVFKDNTPIKTGNAKRNTKQQGKTIHANYAYAGVLDKGRHMTRRGMRGSNQAPEGMTKPTTDFIKKRVAEIMKGK